ncbi:TBC1 domain family member 23 isoform X3 [Brachionus plicatilis]|uniref:TBC1 domain family member 23 isoform X3 n=1 Tax=Brachionus plicatilis TaxID=10195 RepID=A0A3M7RLS2_BRAPC|nr:TBC1 domain family member 23 isoform X3 [Brachionus plicatilis]
MLDNPTEFNQSVEGLLAAQKQAIDAGSVAGGQHLCFMGTGNDEEDRYVNMIVSNFLQRKINYVSLALGGYEELKNVVEDPEMIVGTEVNGNRQKFTEEWVKKINTVQPSNSMFNKFSSVFKARSFDIKDKLKDYINYSLPSPSQNSSNNSNDASKKSYMNLITDIGSKLDYSNLFWSSNKNKSDEKHVSASDRIGKLYRNQGNLFAIDDTNTEDLAKKNSDTEIVNIKEWLEKSDLIQKFKCFYRHRNSKEQLEWTPGYLLLTKTHLYGFTELPKAKNGFYQISVRHHLKSIIKIATKTQCPEILAFTYGEKRTQAKTSQENVSLGTSDNVSTVDSKQDDIPEFDIKGKDWFYVPEYAGEAASAVKLQILEIVEITSHSSNRDI